MNNGFISLCCHFIRYSKYTSSANSLLEDLVWGSVNLLVFYFKTRGTRRESIIRKYSVQTKLKLLSVPRQPSWAICLPFLQPLNAHHCQLLPSVAGGFSLLFLLFSTILGTGSEISTPGQGNRHWRSKTESNKLLQMYNSLAKGANIRCINVLSWFNVFVHPWCMKADGVWKQMQVWWWQFNNTVNTS